MAKTTAPAGRGSAPTDKVDSRGRARIYADIPAAVAAELAILAIRRGKAKKDVLADIIIAAVKAEAKR